MSSPNPAHDKYHKFGNQKEFENLKEKTGSFIFKPTPVNKSEWGKTASENTFNYDRSKTVIKEDGREIKPPSVIGIGAKKCGTIAFATFLAENTQFRTTRYTESHYLYKVPTHQ